MKVLQLCLRIPFPANDGGSIAMSAMAEGLVSQGIHLKMLALNTKKHWVHPDSISKKIISDYHLETVAIDTDVKAVDAFLNLFSSESYNIKRFYSSAFENKLTEVLKNESFDVIVPESLFMSPYIPAIRRITKAKIVLRSHNIEHVIWQRLADNAKNPLKKYYLGLLAKRLRVAEVQNLSEVDAIMPITDEDKSSYTRLGCIKPMQSIPVGINMNQYPDQSDDRASLSLFHLGSMDWRPNEEGVQWFLDQSWPLIHKKFPSLKLFLAGRNFPSHISSRKDANVSFEGEVTDAHAFMKGKQIMVVPLKSGGGMRVKIIQGLALGKTIISTTIGAEGIDYTNNKNILIADTPEEILSAVSKCITNKDYCFQVGKAGRQFAIEKYSNHMIGKRVLKFLETLK